MVKNTPAQKHQQQKRGPKSQRSSCNSTNPFIHYYYEMRSKFCGVVDASTRIAIAKMAADNWSLMSERDKKHYVQLAKACRRRRLAIKRRRRIDAAAKKSAKKPDDQPQNE
ncbi:hypothetical protein QAD02_015364 [Eretmocerus hayati]|uniref:Uncharacterized protein n=1 Tax=Eretmocerus hayati TaxID=131215 RepID=A0ACC2P818_9HYME|nr:hypothetical protein QAD02_015364 [Eretmocerus hayati]